MRLTKPPPTDKRIKITVAELKGNVHLRSKCIIVYEGDFDSVLKIIKNTMSRACE